DRRDHERPVRLTASSDHALDLVEGAERRPEPYEVGFELRGRRWWVGEQADGLVVPLPAEAQPTTGVEGAGSGDGRPMAVETVDICPDLQDGESSNGVLLPWECGGVV